MEPSIFERLNDPEWLRERYWNDELTTAEIASRLQVTQRTVLNYMEHHGIDRRDPGRTGAPDDRLDDPEWLREQYWDEEQTLGDLAAELDVSVATVQKRMIRHGIDRRTPGTSPGRRSSGGER